VNVWLCAHHVMTTKSCCIPEVMCGCANWGSDGDLGCDRMRSNGPVGYNWELIRETKQVREVLRGVGEVTLTGSKHGRLNET